MATKPTADVKVTDKTSDGHESKSLKSAVHETAKDAEAKVETGNVATAKEPADTAPKVYGYTNTRSHPVD